MFQVETLSSKFLISLSGVVNAVDEQGDNKQSYIKELWIWYFPAALCHL